MRVARRYPPPESRSLSCPVAPAERGPTLLQIWVRRGPRVARSCLRSRHEAVTQRDQPPDLALQLTSARNGGGIAVESLVSAQICTLVSRMAG